MSDRTKSRYLQRKSPRQARSNDLVAAILEAAIRVLEAEGAARFTTARVAEKAGISVGSLYQYFPNKAAILYRLQSDEWAQTQDQWEEILRDTQSPPSVRLRELVRSFVQSECLEAALRTALHDAAPLCGDSPEHAEDAADLLGDFLGAALPSVAPERVERIATLIELTLTEAARAFSEKPRDAEEVSAFAADMAAMFEAYLGGFEGWF